ncbi:hypothetical protein AWB74_02106 [Caballeronia arvi]|uniref:Uncharacterized protein n=1 Tax=Caballeronia arvi TaxID=1777135 RepID=A0A158HT69_9BURK|nr:hypothetical protein [Caballeronia arvi]SAL47121.1 hypothetical protein AWB74_02106 [Caballeronia arvi]
MSRYLIKTMCDDAAVELRFVRADSLKNGTTRFTGECPACGHYHSVERKAAPSTLRTNPKADPRRDVTIHGTSIKLKVPYSMSTWQKFAIGNVRFEMIGNGVFCKALDPIPDSWFVDLAADVIEDTVEQDELDLV